MKANYGDICIKDDCIMHKDSATGRVFCTGLKKMYCAEEKCKFYKPKGKKNGKA